jgi:hypothetical protein
MDLDFLGTHSENVSELEAAFMEGKICEVLRRLPPRKAPGPDGFNTEFRQRCLGILKVHFMAAFDKLFTMYGPQPGTVDPHLCQVGGEDVGITAGPSNGVTGGVKTMHFHSQTLHPWQLYVGSTYG